MHRRLMELKTFEEIADELGIKKQTAHEHYKSALDKAKEHYHLVNTTFGERYVFSLYKVSENNEKQSKSEILGFLERVSYLFFGHFLPETQQEIYHKIMFEGKLTRQIAKDMGISHTMVRKHLNNAKKNLIELFNKHRKVSIPLTKKLLIGIDGE